MTDVGKERGWPPRTRASFDAQRGPNGALLIGSPDEVAEKILRHNEAWGGFSWLAFMMNVALLPQVDDDARDRMASVPSLLRPYLSSPLPCRTTERSGR